MVVVSLWERRLVFEKPEGVAVLPMRVSANFNEGFLELEMGWIIKVSRAFVQNSLVLYSWS